MKRKSKQSAYLSIGTVAEMLGFSINTIHKWAASGYLPGLIYHSGRRNTWRFSREAVLRLMAEAYHRGKPEPGQPSQ